MRVLSDGRVRRTDAEWRAILKRFAKSGLTGAEFCAREEISTSAFATWKRKFSESESAPPGFVELKASASTSSPPMPLPAPPLNTEFELALPGGAVLRWKA